MKHDANVLISNFQVYSTHTIGCFIKRDAVEKISDSNGEKHY